MGNRIIKIIGNILVVVAVVFIFKKLLAYDIDYSAIFLIKNIAIIIIMTILYGINVYFPFFDLRYDINIWSELSEDQKIKKDIAMQTAALLDNNYTFFYDENYLIVELNHQPIQSSDWEDKSYPLAPDASFEYKLNTDYSDALFINFYSMLKQKNITGDVNKLQVFIKQYSDGVEIKDYTLEKNINSLQPQNHSITYYNLEKSEDPKKMEIRIEIKNLCDQELMIISPSIKLFDSSELYFKQNYEIKLGDEMKSTGGKRMILHPGDLQYGPYIELPAGNYQVMIHGKNVNLAKVDYCWNLGENIFQPEMMVHSNEWGIYTFHISEEHKNMEFRTMNPVTNQTDIFIDKIIVVNLSDDAVTYNCDDLYSISKNNSLILKPNDFAYGSISSPIGKGEYRVFIEGENIEKIKEKIFLDNNYVRTHVLDVSNTQKVITFHLHRGGEYLYFNIFNEADYDCYINSIHIMQTEK